MQHKANHSVETYCFSVSELSSSIRQMLEGEFSYIKVRGEISGLSISSLGHCYFNLKDSNSVISAVLWKNKIKSVNCSLNDGIEVMISGKITSYSMQSRYQILVDKLELSGVGSYMQMLEKRKELLKKEGLFDLQHKKKLPLLPKKLALLTSIKGSVIQDMLHRISNRCPLEVDIYSVPVQGEGADIQISKTIEKIESLQDRLKPDVIIIARGGGSVEDLMIFNSEMLVRKIFKSSIPVISAIGHETDFSLLDLVADLRAPTPTAAIELVLPVLSDVKYNLEQIFLNINQIINFIIKYNTSLVVQFQDLNKYFWIVDNFVQNFDYISSNINVTLENFINLKLTKLKSLKLAHSYISHLLKNYSENLINYEKNINQYVENIFNQQLNNLENIEIILENINIKKTLNKGFALIKDSNGRYIESIKSLQIDQEIDIELIDGQAKVNVIALLPSR